MTPAHDCLVLNASWIPIETITWQEAFTKIFNGRAIPVEYYEEIIRTPTDEYLKPAVIVCVDYNGMPVRAPVYSKKLVLQRDNYICQYCDKKLTSDDATIDHVTPRANGGRSTFENTVCACHQCNTRKGSKTLEEAGMKLKRKPVRPKVNPIRQKFLNTSVRKEWTHHLEKFINGKLQSAN